GRADWLIYCKHEQREERKEYRTPRRTESHRRQAVSGGAQGSGKCVRERGVRIPRTAPRQGALSEK
ncbi:MAG: hypothetical protein IJR48_07925, partial [Oscillibacter sp.]|nr:hypothetical protein [Oscillibacter sp.]